MRNVNIWSRDDADWVGDDNMPMIRMFEHKGIERTLNEFLAPCLCYSSSDKEIRNRRGMQEYKRAADAQKGTVVLMGYKTDEARLSGEGELARVCNSMDEAVHWLITNGYEFYGEESTTSRRRKVKVADLEETRIRYQNQARAYGMKMVIPVCGGPGESGVGGEVVVTPCVDNSDLNTALRSLNPTPPKSRIIKDSDELARAHRAEEIQHDSSIPVPPAKQPHVHVTLWQKLKTFFLG